jgi:hypothetical protein
MAVAGHPYRFATRTVMTTIGQTTAGCRRVSFRLNPRFRASDFTVSVTTHAVSLEHRCLSRTITLFVRDIVKRCSRQCQASQEHCRPVMPKPTASVAGRRWGQRQLANGIGPHLGTATACHRCIKIHAADPWDGDNYV